MAENSKIKWMNHTFNPWIAGQTGLWNGIRRRTSTANWYQPMKWEKHARAHHFAWAAFRDSNPGLTDAEMEARDFTKPSRRKVFCASLADVFDDQVPDEWRRDLWNLIDLTPHLDWLLLTKRPQNIAKMLPDHGMLPRWGAGWPNVWLGTTVENEDEADRRIPYLLKVPAVKRFLSCEPLLGPIDLTAKHWRDCYIEEYGGAGREFVPRISGIDWVIAGARPMHLDWARSLRDQCQTARVPFFFKQMTKKTPIPEEFMIREFPHA